MYTEEQRAYHATTLAVESDYRKLKELRGRYQSWSAAWEAIKSSHPTVSRDAQWEELETLGIKLILREDDDFPELLREIPWPPFGIYVKGDLPAKSATGVAIVGTRRATPQGKKFAGRLARDLAARGVTIVSGLALGIDAAAHAAAVGVGGKTVAVLGNGLDRTYPREHERLAKEILEANGAIVSEYPPHTPSLPYRFLERNRIVSGLSRGTIVVEAPESSGALATARFALEQNREIFVVPGPVEHPSYVGSHELIKAGATLITNAGDVSTALNLEAAPRTPVARNRALDEKASAILNVLQTAGASLGVQAITDRTGIDVITVTQTLGYLTIEGFVRDENGKFTLA